MPPVTDQKHDEADLNLLGVEFPDQRRLSPPMELRAKNALDTEVRGTLPVYLFDIDGVLTDPLTKKVSAEILDLITASIVRGDVVAFNTGRAAPWVMKTLIEPLLQRDIAPEKLKQIIFVAEKGACWIVWEESTAGAGEFVVKIDDALAIAPSLSEKLQASLASLSPAVFEFDRDKATMNSFEFKPRPGHTIDDEFQIFQSFKPEIVKRLTQVLDSEGQSGSFEVDATTIAIDVQHRSTGKDLGALRVDEYYRTLGIPLGRVLCFGDSRSDLAMMHYLANAGVDAHYFHVGDRRDLPGTPVPASVTLSHATLYDRATASILHSAALVREVPQTNGELLRALTENSHVAPAVSPWYDQVFFAAEKVSIDRASRTITIQIDPFAQPVVSHAGVSAGLPTVQSTGKGHAEGRVTDVSRGLERTIGGEGQRILLSSGSYLFYQDGADEKLVLLRRSLDARVAPGMMQGAAGRCDRAPGESGFRETLEEILVHGTVDGKPVLLIPAGGEEGEVLNAVHDGRRKALAQLRTALKTADSSGHAELKSRIQHLQQVDAVARLVPEVLTAEALENVFRVRTMIGDSCVEDAPSLHAYYDTQSNTLEMRQVTRVNHPDITIVGFEDGDGFGRLVRGYTLNELRLLKDKTHPPTRQFLAEYYGNRY